MKPLLATMLGLGVLHGLGMDHVMAITTLVRRGGSRQTVSAPAWVGLKFGLGHMVVLAVAAAAGLLLRFTVPAGFELAMERAGGLMLLALGVWVLLDLRSDHWVLHAHPHEHGHGKPHTHLHLHRHGLEEHGKDPHHHSHLAWGLGAAFALSGVRSLLVMVPVVLAPRFSVALVYIALFGLGIVLSMSVFGWTATRLFLLAGKDKALDRWAGALTGVASLILGGYWILKSQI